MLDRETREWWSNRGRQDAERGRNALMWPTRTGVFFDLEPPEHFNENYSEDEQREIARAYYNTFINTEQKENDNDEA